MQAISASLDVILEKAGLLQGEVNKQKASIEKTIKEHSSQINEFLISAGYKYQVSIDFENNEYHMKLRHIDYEKAIQNGNQCLSFGEKNALSIVLFMYECISSKADCIILDDPISSFDKNKKYAIIDMLFGKGSGLKNKTVLLLTHDFEPIIDMMYTLRKRYSNSVVASFMEIKNGIIIEKEINKTDIKTFAEICEENINGIANDVIKLIHLRRNYEVINNKSLAYELLSNLFHKRPKPYILDEENKFFMTPEEIEIASSEIKLKIPNFDYLTMIEHVKNDNIIKELYLSSNSNFEKLELFRILTGEAIGSSILRKYINESFHIENDYVMQLNPIHFQTTPSFIIDQCDNELSKLTQTET